MKSAREWKQALWLEIDRRRDGLARLCGDSLRIPAENPTGDTKAITNHYSDLLRGAGLPVERFEPRPGIVSLVSTQQGRAEHPRFVFNGHLDHFPSDDVALWSFPPYGGEVRDGKILGRGSCDMRGGLTASLFSHLLIHQHRVPIAGPLTLMLVADEETGGALGTGHILSTRPELAGDACMIGEPESPDGLRLGEKGKCQFRLVAEGQSRHGGLGTGDDVIVRAPGACTDKHARRHGLAPLTPAVTLREWVEAIRRLLAGEKLTYHGESLQIEGGVLNWRAPRPHVPFWFASMSRTGLRLAGQMADGVLLDAHTSPEYVENALKIVKEAVRQAGRDWDGFEVAQIIPCSVEDTHDEALEAVRWEAASRFESPNFAAETERRLRVGEPAIDRKDFPMLMDALTRGGKAAVAKALPRTLIENTTALGTADEVMSRVDRYRRAGVTFPLIRPQAPHQLPRVLELFAQK